MKAVVMEIRDGYAAVLVKGGSIERIRDKGYKPGQEIEMPRKIIECGGAFRIFTAAAALVLVIFTAGITYRYNLKESAYVTVDVNPSLEYAMNAKCKVRRVTALNDDAKEIADRLKNIGVKGEDLKTALENTKTELYMAGYLGDEKDNVMLVSVVSDDITVRKDLKMAAETVAAQEDIAVYVVESTMSERKEARQQGVSAGRYEVSKKAVTENGSSEIKPQESSVRELVESTTLQQVSTEEAAAAKAASESLSPTQGEIAATSVPTPPDAEATPTQAKKPEKKATPTPSGNDAGNENEVTPTEAAQEGATPTPAAGPGAGNDPTSTPAPTATPTLKPTATPTPKPAAGPTATPTPAPTATPTPKPAEGPTATPTPAPTATPTPKPATGPTSTPTPTPLPTVTPKPTVPPTETPTPTEVPVNTPTPTEAAPGPSDNRVRE